MSTAETSIIESIAAVAKTHIGWAGALHPEMRLVEDLGLDSLKSLTLALEVENHFRVCLDDEVVILTVGDLVATIQEKLDA